MIMQILEFLKEYWFLITFLGTFAIAMFSFCMSMIEATKCSLRNDILTIYDRCKEKKQITHYELESVKHSAEIYFKLKGNSFVESLMKKIEDFEITD